MVLSNQETHLVRDYQVVLFVLEVLSLLSFQVHLGNLDNLELPRVLLESQFCQEPQLVLLVREILEVLGHQDPQVIHYLRLVHHHHSCQEGQVVQDLHE